MISPLSHGHLRHSIFSKMGIIFLLAAQLVTSSAKADPYDTLRTNWVSILTGMTNFTPGSTNNYNTNDPNIAAGINSIVYSGTKYLGYMTGNTNTNYLFSNITNLGTNQDSVFIVSAYNQLEAMALAYVTQGSSLQGNQSLLTNIIRGLDWMNANWYNTNTPTAYAANGIKFPTAWNWFDLEIAAPQALVNTVCLVYTNLSSNQIASYMSAVNWEEQYQASTSNNPLNYTNTPHFTGANCANKANVITVAGVLLKNSNQIAQGSSAYGQIVFPYVTNGDGFYSDGSFVFHSSNATSGSLPYVGGLPYNSGYGISLLDILPSTLQMLSGSSWDMTNYSSSWTNLFTWVYQTFEPIVYKGAALSLCDGRQRVYSSGEHGHGHTVLEDVLRISSFAPPADATRMQSMVKYWAQQDTYYPFIANCSFPLLPAAEMLLANSNVSPLPELTGNFIYPNMDSMVHLKSGWGFGVVGYSTRRFNYESINNENYWGWHQGDGETYIYNNDLGQYSAGTSPDYFWWTVNPYRLPGTTVDSQQKLTNSQAFRTLSTESWMGGTSYGGYGAFGMQLNDANALKNPLVAKKSWFLFDNEVVCLGAGITSTSNDIIESIVENRMLSTTGTDAFSLNGTNFPTTLGTSNSVPGVNWAHLTGRVTGSDISYYFPTPATLQVLRETRTGSQSLVMTNGSTTTVSNNYLTFWFNHGAKPTNATYSYVLLPGYSSSNAAAYASNPSVTFLENSTNAQSVQQTQLGVTAANFWNNATYTSGGITVNSKASVLVQSNGAYIDLSISDPTQTNSGTVSVSYSAPGAYKFLGGSPGISSIITNGSIVGFSASVNNAYGQTFHARFYATTPTVVTYGNTNQIYNGSAEAVTITSVSPTAAQSLISVTYSNATYPQTINPPTNAGTYSVVSFASDTNYPISSTSTLTIAPATTVINVSGTNQAFSGHPQPVTVTTIPQNLPVVTTYSSSSYPPSTTPPTVTGTYLVTASVQESPNYYSATTNAYLTIMGTPSINSSTNTIALQGQSFVYQITALNNPTGFSASNLPSGLYLDTNTGIITGTINQLGTTNFTISSSNAEGSSTVTIQIVTTNSTYTFTNAGITNWICPSNVSSIKVECWGAGGSGGAASRAGFTSGTAVAGGGAGGAYAKLNSYAVTPGNSYYINVGSGGVSSTNDGATNSGSDSWINSTNTPSTNILAKGGAGGQTAALTANATKYGKGGSGTASGSIGDFVNAGGSGATCTTTTYGGGGGGSAGVGVNGNSAVANTGTGASAVTGGGNGGGVNPSTGSGSGQTPTTPPGGGGGGARCANTSTYSGGNGAPGQVVITVTNLMATVALANLTQTYDGTPKTVTTSSSPSNIPIATTYSGISPTIYPASSSAPTNAGTYLVNALTTNSIYNGSGAGTLTISQLTPLISLSGSSNNPYNGSPWSFNASVTPDWMPYSITYNGSQNAPNAAGNYSVVGTISADTVNSNWNSVSTTSSLTIYDPVSSWRQSTYGTSSNSGNASDTASPYGIGLNNLQAYTFGVDPTQPVTVPLLSISNTGSNVLTLSFLARAAGPGPGYSGLTRYYNLEATTNLTNASWAPVSGYSNILGSNQIISLSTNASIGPKWFYRLKAWLK